MPLKGNGFMIVWHDIKSEGEPDYHLWHTREHMPERLGVPGFLRGRRGVDWKLAKYRSRGTRRHDHPPLRRRRRGDPGAPVGQVQAVGAKRFHPARLNASKAGTFEKKLTFLTQYNGAGTRLGQEE